MAELSVRVTETGIQKTDDGLKKLGNTGKATEKTQEKLTKTNKSAADSFVSLGKKVIVAVAAYETFKRVTTAVISTQARFEQSIADLSAITGATGDELAYLSKQAREMGASTTFSASQAADAFKLIASAKPDLLENSEALSEVTEQTLLLAEAAGVQLTDAANTVGTALNQFGADADEAARFVNVLAAGSKLGASEVAQTAEALKNAGVAAAGAGVSFEQANAVIQVFAANGIKGAEAGTALRNIILKLDTSVNEDLRPSVVGLGNAFKNLNDLQLTAEQRVKMFGLENNVAASLVANNAQQVMDLTTALTGTNTAAEQAAIRVDTLSGDFKKLGSASEGLAITLGESTNPSLRFTTQFMTELVTATDRWVESLSEGTEANLTYKMKDLNEQIKELNKDIENSETAWGRLTNVLTFTPTSTTYLQNDLKKLQDELDEARKKYNDLYGAGATDDPVGPFLPKTPETPAEAAAVETGSTGETLTERLARESLARQEEALQKSINAQVEALQQQFKSEEEILQQKIELIKQSDLDILDQLELQEQLETEIRNRKIDAEIAGFEEIQKAKAQAAKDAARMTKEEERAEREKVSLFMNATGMIASALDERSTAYKVAATAQAIASTYATAQEVYRGFNEAFPQPYGMIAGGAAAGAAVGIGLANVAEINKSRAQGGRFNRGDTLELGERGREIITMDGAGTVTPNHKINETTGGGDIIINNNASRTEVTAERGDDGNTYIRVDELDEMVGAALSNANSESFRGLQSVAKLERN